MKTPELLAPGGTFSKLKTALHFGADAVYVAGKQFGLRSYAGNFDEEELRLAAEEKHRRRFVTIVKRMREFLALIARHESLTTSILPFCDGVSVSVKKGEGSV